MNSLIGGLIAKELAKPVTQGRIAQCKLRAGFKKSSNIT